MSFLRIIVVAAAVSGCVSPFEHLNPFEHREALLPDDPAVEPIDPPVYARALDALPHPLLLRQVHVNFPPGEVALQTAIVNALPFAVTVVANDEQVNLDMPISVRAEGITVRTYLKQLEGESGYRIAFEPEEGIVTVSALVTRIWKLPALAGMGNFNARLGFDESDDGDDERGDDVARSHTMQSSVAHDDDVWDSVVSHAHCILGTKECAGDSAAPSQENPGRENPGRGNDGWRTAGDAWLVDNRRLGTISAAGRPQPMALLDRWLSTIVKDSLRLVRLECAILDVALDEQRASGIDFNAIFGDDDFVSVARDSVLRDNADAGWTIGTVVNAGRFDLDLFIRRLSQRADVELKSRARLVVTNAATAYLNTGEVFSYLSGIEAVATDSVATTSFEQSRLQIGLELAVTPRILDDSGRMLVEVVPILSSIVRFDRLGDGANQVDTPVIALRQMSSQAITDSGRPIVIGGLTWSRLAVEERGPGLGGWLKKLLASRSEESESRQLLIVITPWEVPV